jgi:hypothetical protein
MDNLRHSIPWQHGPIPMALRLFSPSDVISLIASFVSPNLFFLPYPLSLKEDLCACPIEVPIDPSEFHDVVCKEEQPRSVRSNLQPLVVLVAMALLMGVAPIHAETVPLSTPHCEF